MISNHPRIIPTSPAIMKMGYVKKPRSQPLGRGKACTNCRHLKIKCDGAKPICGQCTRIPRDDDCEYLDARSRISILGRHTLDRLQNQRDLKPASSPPVMLSHPTYGPVHDYMSQAASGSNTPISFVTSLPSEAPYIPSPEAPSQVVDTREMLVEKFLPHACQFGFFLNVSRFQSFLYSIGDSGSQLFSSLVSCVYLWGAHLSQMPEMETLCLRDALTQICTDVSSCTDLSQVIQVVQAQILLATYFLRANRQVEALYHANGAMTLALAWNLHRTLSSRTFDAGTTVSDSIHQGEIIDAFWETLFLRKILTLTMDRSRDNRFETFEPSDNTIDTPWPLCMLDYEMGIVPPATQLTLQTIFSPEASTAEEGYHFMSPRALRMKSVVILHRSIYLAARWSPNFSADQHVSYHNAQRVLERAARKILSIIDILQASSQDDYPCLHVTRAMIQCALMKLIHTSCASSLDSRMGCHGFVRATVGALKDGNCLAVPAMGTLCILAAEVLVEDLNNLTPSRPRGGIGDARDNREADMRLTSQLILEFMRTMTPNNALMSPSNSVRPVGPPDDILDYQLGLVERLFYAIQ